MCQIRVVVGKEGGEEKLLDDVTGLEVTQDGVVLSTFFAEPKTVPGVGIARIDFLGGKVILSRGPVHAHARQVPTDTLEKLRVLLPHWLEHNAGHGREFAGWAEKVEGDSQEVAALLRKAADSLQAADAALRKALHLSGGGLRGHGPDHHNLPE